MHPYLRCLPPWRCVRFVPLCFVSPCHLKLTPFCKVFPSMIICVHPCITSCWNELVPASFWGVPCPLNFPSRHFVSSQCLGEPVMPSWVSSNSGRLLLRSPYHAWGAPLSRREALWCDRRIVSACRCLVPRSPSWCRAGYPSFGPVPFKKVSGPAL